MGTDIVAAAEAGAGRGAGHSRGKSPLSPRKQFSKSFQNDRLCLLTVQKEALAEGGDGGASLTQWPLDRLRLLLAVRPLIFQFAHAHPLDCPVCICRASYDEYNTGWMADLA